MGHTHDDGIRYDAYVAKLYDTYVSSTFDVPFFLNEAKHESGEVLELMSGTGRVSIPLIEAGVQLTCVDISPDMLAVLREKLDNQKLSAYVHEMDVRSLNLDKHFNLVSIPFNSFSELLETPDQLQVLSGIYDHLKGGGRFICTLHNPTVRLKRVDGLLRFVRRCEMDNGVLLVWSQQVLDDPRHIVRGLQFFEEYDTTGVMRRRTLMETQFCPINKDQFSEMVMSAGFRVVCLYSDYAYSSFREDSSPSMVWVLEKP